MGFCYQFVITICSPPLSYGKTITLGVIVQVKRIPSQVSPFNNCVDILKTWFCVKFPPLCNCSFSKYKWTGNESKDLVSCEKNISLIATLYYSKPNVVIKVKETNPCKKCL